MEVFEVKDEEMAAIGEFHDDILYIYETYFFDDSQLLSFLTDKPQAEGLVFSFFDVAVACFLFWFIYKEDLGFYIYVVIDVASFGFWVAAFWDDVPD